MYYLEQPFPLCSSQTGFPNGHRSDCFATPNVWARLINKMGEGLSKKSLRPHVSFINRKSEIKLEYKPQQEFLLFLRESERGEPRLNRSKDCHQLLVRKCLFRIGFQLFLLEHR